MYFGCETFVSHILCAATNRMSLFSVFCTNIMTVELESVAIVSMDQHMYIERRYIFISFRRQNYSFIDYVVRTTYARFKEPIHCAVPFALPFK